LTLFSFDSVSSFMYEETATRTALGAVVN